MDDLYKKSWICFKICVLPDEGPPVIINAVESSID